MAKNHVKIGHKVTLIAPTGGVVSGNLYVIGKLNVIASFDAAEGEEFEAYTGEVWRLPKVSADTPSQGALAYWTGTEVTTTASGNTKVGHFLKDYAANTTEAEVRLEQFG